jgi:hypothetical protein
MNKRRGATRKNPPGDKAGRRAKNPTKTKLIFEVVRSEGGEDVSNFNNLQGWAKGQVHFPPIGAFQAEHQS